MSIVSSDPPGEGFLKSIRAKLNHLRANKGRIAITTSNPHMIQMAADNTSGHSGSSLVNPRFGLSDESFSFISVNAVPFTQGPYRGGLYFSLHGISANYIAMFGPLVVQSLCPLLPPTAHNCRT
jgi:hypothetical protein